MALNKLNRSQSWLNADGTPTNEFAQIIETLIDEINAMTANTQLFNIRPDSDAPVAQYRAKTSAQGGGQGTVITKFTATDPAGTATYNVYIGTSAGDSTKIIDSEVATTNGVAPVTLIDQLVKPGDSIFLEPSAADTIVFYASGNERI